MEGAGVDNDSDWLCSPTGCGRLQTLRRWHMLLLSAFLIEFKCQMLTVNKFYQRWAPNMIFVAVFLHLGRIMINNLFDLCRVYFISNSRDVWSQISAVNQKFSKTFFLISIFILDFYNEETDNLWPHYCIDAIKTWTINDKQTDKLGLLLLRPWRLFNWSSSS